MTRDNHITVTIPARLLKDVFANEHARGLLLLLDQAEEPVRYSDARRSLDLHPQQFQRALDRLEDLGLLGMRAPADLNKGHAERDYYVFLELTGLGEFAADLWDRIDEGFSTLAREHGIPEQALAAAAGSS